MNEIWKEIEGYEGLYEVSNMGRVRSLDRSVIHRGKQMVLKGRVLKPGTNKEGYHFVILCKEGKKKLTRVHRLVAEAFIQNLDNKPCIDHINTERTDNRVENLKWCTYSENNLNPITLEKVYTPVAQYSLDCELIAVYPSINEAVKQTGCNKSGICRCCTGGYFDKSRGKWHKYTQYKGYVWKYHNVEGEL